MSRFNLQQFSRILVRCRPEDTSAREFLARIICQRETNQDCKIERQLIGSKGHPLIEIEFDNKEKLQLEPSSMTVDDIVNMLKNRADEMDMNARLQAAGLAKHRFAGDFATGRDFVGTKHKIPRQ